MTLRGPNQCSGCKHLKTSPITNGYGAAWTCAAFPNGIPASIVNGADHRTPIGGELRGITFEMAETEFARVSMEGWEAVYNAV